MNGDYYAEQRRSVTIVNQDVSCGLYLKTGTIPDVHTVYGMIQNTAGDYTLKVPAGTYGGISYLETTRAIAVSNGNVSVDHMKLTPAPTVPAAPQKFTAMQRAGIVRGKEGNRFDPQGNATRAEVSAPLRRFVEIVIDPAAAQGWLQNDSGQWLYYKDGKAAIGWKQVGDKWYYFDMNGVCKERN